MTMAGRALTWINFVLYIVRTISAMTFLACERTGTLSAQSTIKEKWIADYAILGLVLRTVRMRSDAPSLPASTEGRCQRRKQSRESGVQIQRLQDSRCMKGREDSIQPFLPVSATGSC